MCSRHPPLWLWLDLIPRPSLARSYSLSSPPFTISIAGVGASIVGGVVLFIVFLLVVVVVHVVIEHSCPYLHRHPYLDLLSKCNPISASSLLQLTNHCSAFGLRSNDCCEWAVATPDDNTNLHLSSFFSIDRYCGCRKRTACHSGLGTIGFQSLQGTERNHWEALHPYRRATGG